MKLLKAIIALFLITISTYGQIGREFWFAMPEITDGTDGTFDPNNGLPIYFNITSLYATTVKISKPADPGFEPIIRYLDNMDKEKINIANFLDIDQIETQATSNLLSPHPHGFLIESWPGEIAVTVEWDNDYNREIMPLKGHNALGRDFWVSTQNYWPSDSLNPPAKSGFAIVAAEDGTQVTVYKTMGFNHFNITTPETLVFNLDKGETFAFEQVLDISPHINGIHVTSTKDIAITVKDDAIDFNNNCAVDLIADQIVPTANIGQEYFIKKGQLDSEEYLFITGTANGTNFTYNGVGYTLNAGELERIEVVTDSAHIISDQPVYINQVTGIRCEPAMAILPSNESCIGSNVALFTRGDNALDELFPRIIARNDALDETKDNFFLIVNDIDTTKIPSGYFNTSAAGGGFVYLRDGDDVKSYFSPLIRPGWRVKIYNRVSRFHFGVLSGHKTSGAKYGFISLYDAPAADAGICGYSYITDSSSCSLEPTQLAAWGGTSYVWTGISDASIVQYLSNDSIADPIFDPDTGGVYIFNVEISGTCIGTVNIKDTLNYFPQPGADFFLDKYEVCSRDSILIENISNTTNTAREYWTFEPIGDTINQLSNPFYYVIPDNNTDAIQTFTATLHSFSPGDYCENTRSQTFTVKPHVETSFTSSDLTGCSPWNVNFEETAVSGHDSLYFRWDFGNGAQSDTTHPSITYNNLEGTTQIYDVELVVETPFGCTDTSNTSVTVYPLVEAAFGVDTNLSCSPLNATLDPSGSINADSVFWFFDYITDGSQTNYFTDTTEPYLLTHVDNTILAGPDTIAVYLAVKNEDANGGCTDTSSAIQLYVYPNIVADFTISNDSICDGGLITFNNTSFGYNARYEWDFGNNSYAQDSSLISHPKNYFNRSNKDTTYYARLRAISGNICSDSKDTAIVVHPYVKADFGFEYINNCSPLEATISNTSIGGDTVGVGGFFWELGDGSTSTFKGASFDHTYTNILTDRDTTYTIRLSLESPQGCTDTLERTLNLLPRVVADFDIAESYICSHNDVNFTNNSTGNNLTYLWSYGDGQSSTTSDTTFSKYYENNFVDDTNYVVILTTRNAIGCTDADTNTIEVLANISALFSLHRVDSCSPFTTRLLTRPDSSAKAFRWDFGDGSPINTLANPVFPTYINDTGIVARTFTISLEVAGADDPKHWGCMDAHSVNIELYPELRADFSLDNIADCQPLIANFTNLTVPNKETKFRWYHNNQYYSTQETPDSITIPNNTATDSTHRIWLYGESRYGCRDTAFSDVNVYALVDAGFTINRLGMCDYDSVYIDRNSSRGDLANIVWDFNGDSFSTFDTDFSYSFDSHNDTTPQNRRITLTINNSHPECIDSMSHDILIYPTVTAGFSVDSLASCAGHTTNFYNSSENSDHWLWTFGDGLSSTQFEPTHFYNNHSTTLDSVYNIQLTVRSDYDCYDDTTGSVTIYAKPRADFYFPVTIACPPFTVEMKNNSEPSTGLDYVWTYADSTSNEKDVSFIIDNDSTAIVQQFVYLKVITANGCMDSTQNSIQVYPNLEASIITNNDTSGCSPHSMSFELEESEVPPKDVLWYVDDFAFSSASTTDYRFVNPDQNNTTHTVKVIARSVNNCIDSSTINITVFPTPEIQFSASPIPAEYDFTNDQTLINFVNSTEHQSNWEYEWDFGDGTTVQFNEPNAEFTHIYGDHFWGDKEDNFRVPITLLARNTDNAICEDVDSMKIIINPPVPQVEIDEDISGCPPLTVDFSAVTKYIYEDSFEWEFGHNTSTSNNAEASYTYTEPGKYHVTLTVEGDYGRVSDYKIIEVFPKPIVDFTFNDTVVSIDIDTINFYNHSLNAIENFWYFDAENIFSGMYDSDEPNPKWIYREPGKYYPALVSKSTDDCYDTLISDQYIDVYEVGLIEFPNAFLVIPGQPSEEYATDQSINGGNRYLFYPKHESVERYHLEIFNRWGSKIFESFDVNRGWNGLIEGVTGKQDAYVFRCRGRFINGQSFDISGDVTLLYSKPAGQQ